MKSNVKDSNAVLFFVPGYPTRNFAVTSGMNRLTYLFAGYLRRDLTLEEEGELKVFLGDEPNMRAFEMLLIHEDEIFDDALLAMETATRVLSEARRH